MPVPPFSHRRKAMTSNLETASNGEIREFLNSFTPDEETVVTEKLQDAMNAPGVAIEFDPEEAELAGAHPEDAISYDDALAGALDLVDID